MAKYKFTKTIKPTEGICIDANGTVTNLSTPSIPKTKRTVVIARVEKPRTTIASAMRFNGNLSRIKSHRAARPETAPYLRVSVSPCENACSSKPRNKPVVVVPLSSVNNPYYGEPALHDIPPARPCGMFGLSRPKPITRTVAMSFQNRGG